MKRIMLATALFAMTKPAFATSYVEAAYAGGSQVFDDDIDKLETEDSGFLLRGAVDLAPNLFARISYASLSSDRIELNGTKIGEEGLDTDVLRAGFGAYGGTAFQVFGALEYVQEKHDVSGLGSDTERGALLAMGLRDANRTPFLWNVELGYQHMKYSRGAYFSFDLGWRVTPNLAIVWGGTGYSRVDEDDSDLIYTLGVGSLGLRYQFGSQAPAAPAAAPVQQGVSTSAAPARNTWMPPPAPQAPQKVLVTATAMSGLPRRSGNTLALIPAGTVVQPQSSMSNDEGLWWFVQYDGKQGWVPNSAFTR